MPEEPGTPDRLPDDFALDRVELTVADRARSLGFYAGVLGLADTPTSTDDVAAVGIPTRGDARTLVRLHVRDGAKPSMPRTTGLFHVALLLPTRRDLARFVRHLIASGTPVAGASDHAVSEAIYLEDPDGHGVEVYADRPRETWPRDGSQLAMRTDPLDVDDLLGELDGDGGSSATGPVEPWSAPAGTTLGHVHLRVRDVPEARRFYLDTFGFDETTTYPGASFLAAGGYHHHVAVNSWSSAGAPAAPASTARLLGVHASLGNAEGFAALRRRVEAPDALGEGASLTFDDPSGIRWTIARR